jgi:hypothetical protein
MLESPEPCYQEALETIIAAARRHGVATGIMVSTAEQANRRAEQGFNMMARPGPARHPHGDPRGGLDGLGVAPLILRPAMSP